MAAAASAVAHALLGSREFLLEAMAEIMGRSSSSQSEHESTTAFVKPKDSLHVRKFEAAKRGNWFFEKSSESLGLLYLEGVDLHAAAISEAAAARPAAG